MVARRALVLVEGSPAELPQGDTLAGASGGSSALSGTATITLPASGEKTWTETIAAIGVTPAQRIFLSLAPALADDENDPEWLGACGLSASPAADSLTITACFAEPASGPVKINWSAF